MTKHVETLMPDALGGQGGVPLAAKVGAERRLDIQGLRAVAVVFVVAFHAGLPVPGGFVGVDVFFVISGFVITSMLSREWVDTGRLRLGVFYMRRFKRLTPALVLMVTVTLAAAAIVLSPLGIQQKTVQTALGAMFLCANAVIAVTTGGYFDAPAGTNPLLNTWSLSVEEQFYLAFPLILVLAWYMRERSASFRVMPIAIVAGIAAGSLFIAVGASFGYRVAPSILLGFYSPFTRAWEFAAGALLALAGQRAHLRSHTATAFALAGAAMLVISLWAITPATPFPGIATVIPVVGTVLLIYAGGQPSNPVRQALSMRPMVILGDLSYSWYLWHWPMIVFASLLWPGNFVAAITAALLSLVPAVASFRWVEQPLRTLSVPTISDRVRLVAFTFIPGIALSLLVLLALNHGYWSPAIQHSQIATLPTHGQCMDRDDARALILSGAKRQHAGVCQWNVAAMGAPIYLVGDSNADQFTEAVVSAGARLHRPVMSLVKSSCPLLDLQMRKVAESKFFPLRRGAFDTCPSYVHRVLAWLGSAAPGTVIMASLDQYWWDPAIAVMQKSAPESSDSRVKVGYMREALRHTVRHLTRAAHQVAVIHTIPTYRYPAPSWDPLRCSVWTVMQYACARSLPLSVLNEVQGDTRYVIEEVAAETGAQVIDLRRRFCRDGICSTQPDGIPLYRDATHISSAASSGLAPEFAQAIARSR